MTDTNHAILPTTEYMLFMTEATGREKPGSTVWSRTKSLLDMHGWARINQPNVRPGNLCVGQAIAQIATGDPSDIYQTSAACLKESEEHPLYLLLQRVAQVTGADRTFAARPVSEQVWEWNDQEDRTYGQIVMVLVTLHAEALSLVYNLPLNLTRAKGDDDADAG